MVTSLFQLFRQKTLESFFILLFLSHPIFILSANLVGSTFKIYLPSYYFSSHDLSHSDLSPGIFHWPSTYSPCYVLATLTYVYYSLIDLKVRLILLTWKSDHVAPLLKTPSMTSHIIHNNSKILYSGPQCCIQSKYHSLTSFRCWIKCPLLSDCHV